jgi:hypothetical protein
MVLLVKSGVGQDVVLLPHGAFIAATPATIDESGCWIIFWSQSLI